MTSESSWREPSAWLLGVGGPLLLGAVLGIPKGTATMLSGSLMLPGVLLGVTLMMAPALYIGLSLIGAAPPGTAVAGAMGRALRVSGTVMAGLAPAAAFLLVTVRADLAVWILGTLVVGGACLAGVRLLFRQLIANSEVRLRAIPLFGFWTIISLGLGAHFFFSALG